MASDERCKQHGARLANEAFFECGCRWFRASDERAAVPDAWVDVPARGLVYHLLRGEIAAALAAQGLHVVTDADMRVLEAMRDADIYTTADGRQAFASVHREHLACEAELARREGKP